MEATSRTIATELVRLENSIAQMENAFWSCINVTAKTIAEMEAMKTTVHRTRTARAEVILQNMCFLDSCGVEKGD